MSGQFSGYHDCPCRDCFEIAIGERACDDECGVAPDDEHEHVSLPALCNACESAGCDPDGDEGCSVEPERDPDDDDDDDEQERP